MMDIRAARDNDISLIMDLLPVGTVLCHDRIITSSNGCFADLFGYQNDDLQGMSLERLYPSHSEFVHRGDEWHGYMSRCGWHCDERFMLRKDNQPIWVRVKGRCLDPGRPYLSVACTFELMAPAPCNGAALSPRERAIVDAMGEGLTSKEIARRLGLSHRTVETYRSRLMAKTGARNATQLIAMVA